MEIGLLGGTFDPIHLGHLIIAEEVRIKLGLSKIIFVPAGHPWLKADKEITAGEHRLAMIELAIEANPHFEVSSLELDRPGPSYTVDTVAALREELGPENMVYFIVGPDALADLPRWKEPERVISLCQIVGVNRPGVPDVDLAALESVLPEVYSCVKFIDVPQIDISATEIRERVRDGLSIRDFVPMEVEGYIYEHSIYSEH